MGMDLRRIGLQVRERRQALGLSQQGLARLAGLSRATVNQLENGTLNDLGLAKLAGLLDLVGLELHASERSRTRGGRAQPLQTASRTASVSYRRSIPPGELAKVLSTGELPDEWLPHVATFLDEAPLPLVVSAVEEAARVGHVAPKRVWQHLTRWAHALRSPRGAWA